jgi:hypothetical protein
MSLRSDIGGMIKSLQAMEGMAEKCMPEMAVAIQQELHRTIAAGTTPYGEPWQKTQADPDRGVAGGETPLRHAAKAVTVNAVGKSIYILVDGPEAKHHLGSARGKIKRRIIPSKKQIPQGMLQVMKQVLDRYFISEVKHA